MDFSNDQIEDLLNGQFVHMTLRSRFAETGRLTHRPDFKRVLLPRWMFDDAGILHVILSNARTFEGLEHRLACTLLDSALLYNIPMYKATHADDPHGREWHDTDEVGEDDFGDDDEARQLYIEYVNKHLHSAWMQRHVPIPEVGKTSPYSILAYRLDNVFKQYVKAKKELVVTQKNNQRQHDPHGFLTIAIASFFQNTHGIQSHLVKHPDGKWTAFLSITPNQPYAQLGIFFPDSDEAAGNFLPDARDDEEWEQSRLIFFADENYVAATADDRQAATLALADKLLRWCTAEKFIKGEHIVRTVIAHHTHLWRLGNQRLDSAPKVVPQHVLQGRFVFSRYLQAVAETEKNNGL